jgi:hypothetical protein
MPKVPRGRQILVDMADVYHGTLPSLQWFWPGPSNYRVHLEAGTAMKRLVVHTWSRKKINGVLCGPHGGYVTGHFDSITCGNCRRIILRSKKLMEYYRVMEWLNSK